MLLHLDTLCWFLAISLWHYSLNMCACSEEAANTYLIVFGLTWPHDSNPRSTTLETSKLTITLLIQCSGGFFIASTSNRWIMEWGGTFVLQRAIIDHWLHYEVLQYCCMCKEYETSILQTGCIYIHHLVRSNCVSVNLAQLADDNFRCIMYHSWDAMSYFYIHWLVAWWPKLLNSPSF